MPAHTITPPPPWATRSITFDIRKSLTHTTHYTLSTICPVQRKPGFIREENTSPKCQMPSNVSICPLKLVTTMNCSQVETPMRTTSMQLSFPQTVSDSLCRNSLVMQTDCCSSCPGVWSQTILEVKMLDVEVLGWYVYTWSAVVRPVGFTAKLMPHLWGDRLYRQIRSAYNIWEK